MRQDDADRACDTGIPYIGAGPADPHCVSVDAVTLELLAVYETVVVHHKEHPGLKKEANKFIV